MREAYGNSGHSRGRKKRSRRVRAAHCLRTGMIAMLLVMLCSFGFGIFSSEAHGNRQDVLNDADAARYYKSIQIQEGDSLWSIAERYTDGYSASVKDYVDELAELNQIPYSERNHLQAGDYLMVAYSDSGR